MKKRAKKISFRVNYIGAVPAILQKRIFLIQNKTNGAWPNAFENSQTKLWSILWKKVARKGHVSIHEIFMNQTRGVMISCLNVDSESDKTKSKLMWRFFFKVRRVFEIQLLVFFYWKKKNFWKTWPIKFLINYRIDFRVISIDLEI